jgi:hypothetical protein
MTFGSLQLATVDVASGNVTVLRGFTEGKHINPQYTSDGRSLLFISDQDGVSDLYRMDLTSSQLFRITRLKTGVSGVTATSPALSVARQTGRAMFTVFKDQGHEIVALDANQLAGEPVNVTGQRVASAATLPPGDVGRADVATYLADATTGLVSGSEFRVTSYRPSFQLDWLGQPVVGVTTGGYYGTGLVGAVSALFGDQLGDQQIYTALQANGTVKDFGGAVAYVNLKRRLNWVASASHIPILTGYRYGESFGNDIVVTTVLQRIYYDQVALSSQYPFSQTKRVELGLSGFRLALDQQVERALLNQFGQVIERVLEDSAGPPPAYYGQATLAFAGDNSYAGFTSPIMGTRYRIEATPTVGTLNFQAGLADYRKYFFMRPVSLAFRGLHVGRYGKDADDETRLIPIYVGDERFIRGYSITSIETSECGTTTDCPVFQRLLGSKIGVVNAELRIPLLGTAGFGLINFPYLPLELAPFFDAGIAWTGTQEPELRWATRADDTPADCAGRFVCAERIPVFSTGLSARINLLGYMILETYVAKPFQRPDRRSDWVWGFQIAPGW